MKNGIIVFGVVLVVFLMIISNFLKGSDNTEVNEPNVTETAEPQKKNKAISAMFESTKDKSEKKLFSENLDSELNNQWNINRRGLIARNANHYYYADEKFGILYRVDIDGLNRVKISSDTNIEYLNIVDGWIYYITNTYSKPKKLLERKKGRLCKVNLAGTTRITSEINANMILVDGENIFYSNNGDHSKLYKVDIDFKNPTKLDDKNDINGIYVVNDNVYYLADDGIYKVNHITGVKNIVVSSTNIGKFGVDEGSIFYKMRSTNLLYRASLKEPTNGQLVMDGVRDFIVRNNMIYYKTGRGRDIYKVLSGNKTPTKLKFKDIKISEFTVIGNAIFTTGRYRDRVTSHGYSLKVIDNASYEGLLAKNIIENELGLNFDKMLDYVGASISIEDRNTIMQNIQKDINQYFEGNSCATTCYLLDYDNDYLKEMILIHKKYITDDGTKSLAIKTNNQIQVIFTVIKWDGNELINFKESPLNLAADIASGYVTETEIILYDVLPGGFNEVIIKPSQSSIRLNSKLVDAFKFNENSVEMLNIRSEFSKLRKLGIF